MHIKCLHSLLRFYIGIWVLQNNWYFSFNNQNNLTAELESFTAYKLTINKEVHILLTFKVESANVKLSSGVLSNTQIPHFSEYKIESETSKERLVMVTNFIINNYSNTKESISNVAVYSISNNSLLVQWNSGAKLRFNRPNGMILTIKNEQLFAFEKVPVISSYDDHTEYSEDLSYMAAYRLNGNSFFELQHRYDGRFSARDSIISYTDEGAILCDMMILGSD